MEQGILKLERGGECRRRPSAHASACWFHNDIRKVTLSQKKTQDVGDRSGRGASKNHYYHGIYRFKTVMELKRGINIMLGCI